MKCPKCHKEEFEFVESYKKHINIFIKIGIYYILIIIAIIGLFTNAKIGATAITILILSVIIIKIIEKQMSRKTRTKAICKNCGKTFYLK